MGGGKNKKKKGGGGTAGSGGGKGQSQKSGKQKQSGASITTKKDDEDLYPPEMDDEMTEELEDLSVGESGGDSQTDVLGQDSTSSLEKEDPKVGRVVGECL